MLSTVMENLKRLRSQLKQIDVLIADQEHLCSKEPNSFAYKLALISLQNHKKEVEERILELRKESNIQDLDIVLNSEKLLKGTAPITLVANTLLGIQNIINSIAQAISSGSSERGPISGNILKECQLNLAEVYPGSFGMKIEGIGQPDLFGESLLEDSLSTFYQILEAGSDSDKLIDYFADLGSRALSHYKDWLSKLESEGISVSLQWENYEGNNRKWHEDASRMKTVRESLNSIVEVSTEEIKLEGILVGANILRGKFEFVVAKVGSKISGKVFSDIKDLMKDYFGKQCRATFQKEVLNNITTNQVKESWTLIALEHIDYINQPSESAN